MHAGKLVFAQVMEFAHLSPIGHELSGRLQRPHLQLPRPVPVHGLRAADLPGEPARHRSLPGSTTGQDQHTLVSAKLDFYKVVQSGGHMLVLLGLFCTATGVVCTWYRQRREWEL
jgi:hypothetical protein